MEKLLLMFNMFKELFVCYSSFWAEENAMNLFYEGLPLIAGQTLHPWLQIQTGP